MPLVLSHTHTHSYPAVPQVTDIRDWEDEEGGEVGNSTDSSSEEEEGMMAEHSLDSQLPLLVLPLYSLLSTKLQTKVCVVIATTTPTSLSYKTVLVAQILYRIAGIFSELVKIYFHRENVHRLLAGAAKRYHVPKCRGRKIFVNSHKT